MWTTDETGAELYAELARGDRDSYRREARFVTKDGRTVITHFAAALVRDADGKPDYMIGMAEDVTQQKQLEDQLRQSQKLEAIGRLAGGVSHDFNNMLTAIGGYTAFALEHADEGSPLRSDLDEIRKATERAALLTRQLLAFSRKQVLTPELLDLNEIVVELQTMLRPLIGEDIVLSMKLDPALGQIEADPGQLQQVVMNLVVNARDAMPAGGALSIETANADVVDELGEGSIAPGRYVTLTVRDAGEGIDEATLSQIFEPFFTTKDSDKGTGLGLSTVYGIVKQSGGFIAVESEVGVGSEFTMYLRRATDVRQPTTRGDPHACARAGAAGCRGQDRARGRGRGRRSRPRQAGARGRRLRRAGRQERRGGLRARCEAPHRRAPVRPDAAEAGWTRGRRPAAQPHGRSSRCSTCPGTPRAGSSRTASCRREPPSSKSRSPSPS